VVVVIPNARKNDAETIKGDIDELLTEMECAGLDNGLPPKSVTIRLYDGFYGVLSNMHGKLHGLPKKVL